MSLLKITLILIPAIIIVILATQSYLTRQHKIKAEGERELSPCPSTPNCVSSLATEPSQRIDPLPVTNDDQDASWKKLISAIKSSGGEILLDDGRYAHAVFTSPLFRFRDDVEAIFNAGHIDIRSASRAGKSDLGKNRKRVISIREIFLSQ